MSLNPNIAQKMAHFAQSSEIHEAKVETEQPEVQVEEEVKVPQQSVSHGHTISDQEKSGVISGNPSRVALLKQKFEQAGEAQLDRPSLAQSSRTTEPSRLPPQRFRMLAESQLKRDPDFQAMPPRMQKKMVLAQAGFLKTQSDNKGIPEKYVKAATESLKQEEGFAGIDSKMQTKMIHEEASRLMRIDQSPPPERLITDAVANDTAPPIIAASNATDAHGGQIENLPPQMPPLPDLPEMDLESVSLPPLPPAPDLAKQNEAGEPAAELGTRKLPRKAHLRQQQAVQPEQKESRVPTEQIGTRKLPRTAHLRQQHAEAAVKKEGSGPAEQAVQKQPLKREKYMQQARAKLEESPRFRKMPEGEKKDKMISREALRLYKENRASRSSQAPKKEVLQHSEAQIRDAKAPEGRREEGVVLDPSGQSVPKDGKLSITNESYKEYVALSKERTKLDREINSLKNELGDEKTSSKRKAEITGDDGHLAQKQAELKEVQSKIDITFQKIKDTGGKLELDRMEAGREMIGSYDRFVDSMQVILDFFNDNPELAKTLKYDLAVLQQVVDNGKLVSAELKEAITDTSIDLSKLEAVFTGDSFRNFADALGSYSSNFESINAKVFDDRGGKSLQTSYLEKVGVSLQAELVKPVQQGPRFPLLLGDLAKHIPGDTVSKLVGVADDIMKEKVNEKVRAKEIADRKSALGNLANITKSMSPRSKLALDSEGKLTTTDRMGTRLSRVGKSDESQEALSTLLRELDTLVKNSAPHRDDLNELQMVFVDLKTNEWFQAALKNNPELGGKFTGLTAKLAEHIEHHTPEYKQKMDREAGFETILKDQVALDNEVMALRQQKAVPESRREGYIQLASTLGSEPELVISNLSSAFSPDNPDREQNLASFTAKLDQLLMDMKADGDAGHHLEDYVKKIRENPSTFINDLKNLESEPALKETHASLILLAKKFEKTYAKQSVDIESQINKKFKEFDKQHPIADQKAFVEYLISKDLKANPPVGELRTVPDGFSGKVSNSEAQAMANDILARSLELDQQNGTEAYLSGDLKDPKNELLQFQNNLSLYATDSVYSQASKKEAATALANLVDTAYVLTQKGDFASAKALMDGLGREKIPELAEKLLSGSSKARFKQLQELYSSDKNYGKLRATIQSADRAIPPPDLITDGVFGGLESTGTLATKLSSTVLSLKIRSRTGNVVAPPAERVATGVMAKVNGVGSDSRFNLSAEEVEDADKYAGVKLKETESEKASFGIKLPDEEKESLHKEYKDARLVSQLNSKVGRELSAERRAFWNKHFPA